MANTASPILDPDTITELRRAKADYGNPLLIRQLVEIYRANAPKRIEQLHSAIASGDARSLGLVAHTLKTNCAMLGAIGMAALCATLEQRGDKAALEQKSDKATLERDGGSATLGQDAGKATLDDAAGVLAKLEAEFGRVLAALAQLLEEEPTNA